MQSFKYIGHVAAHHLESVDHPLQEVDAIWDSLLPSLGAHDAFVVREFGSKNGHAHYHYYIVCGKSKTTVFNKLQSAFSRAGCLKPGQHVSCKLADESKLAEYFRYLCKGPHGEKMEFPLAPLAEMAWIIVDLTRSRMVESLHEAYHSVAAEIRAVRAGKKGPSVWYETLAALCKEKKLTSREDVMEQVTKHYVYESKKGFDKFAVTRTFWAVFALVNGEECHALILSQCMDMVRG